jgi:hypothetical protein
MPTPPNDGHDRERQSDGPILIDGLTALGGPPNRP